MIFNSGKFKPTNEIEFNIKEIQKKIIELY